MFNRSRQVFQCGPSVLEGLHVPAGVGGHRRRVQLAPGRVGQHDAIGIAAERSGTTRLKGPTWLRAVRAAIAPGESRGWRRPALSSCGAGTCV